MSSSFPDIDKFMHGQFYQVKEKDAQRIAKRIFQIYDKDASLSISVRESKQILKNIYAGIDPKKKFTEAEVKEFIEVLDFNKDGVLTERDFEETVKYYFVNNEKNGSLDLQQKNPDMFALVGKTEFKVDSDELYKQLYDLASKRFGEGFIKDQMINAENLFNEADRSHDDKLNYDEFYEIFVKIYKDIGMITKKQSPLKREDIMRLVEMIDYDNDNLICMKEFKIYFLKGILGS